MSRPRVRPLPEDPGPVIDRLLAEIEAQAEAEAAERVGAESASGAVPGPGSFRPSLPPAPAVKIDQAMLAAAFGALGQVGVWILVGPDEKFQPQHAKMLAEGWGPVLDYYVQEMDPVVVLWGTAAVTTVAVATPYAQRRAELRRPRSEP